MKKNSVEIKSALSKAYNRCKELKEIVTVEKRNLTEEEEKELDGLKEEIEEKKRELEDLEEELKSYDFPEEDKEEEKDCDKEPEKEETKNKKRNRSMKTTLVKEIRNALNEGRKNIKVNAETRTMQVTGAQGVHDSVVETEIQGILEPLYAESVLSKLGVRWYKGLPQGDIQVPIMGKGTCGWAGEVAAAGATGNEFTTKKLSPKRLTAYVDISKQLIAQDTIGVEAAIRRDIVNALNDKLEATILGNAAKTDEKPAGIFYGVQSTTIDDYAALCDFEADIDDTNVTGERKYLLSNKARAALRCMIKGTNSTGMVLEGNSVDGTPELHTSNVANSNLVYGNFNYLAIGSWGDIDITLDEYTQAVNGCVRLVINAYFDAVILRPEAFAYGVTE